jgi:hypothetical protein
VAPAKLTFLGLITYCVPCVTFGKTHHRTRKDANMAGYEPINTSVCVFSSSRDLN